MVRILLLGGYVTPHPLLSRDHYHVCRVWSPMSTKSTLVARPNEFLPSVDSVKAKSKLRGLRTSPRPQRRPQGAPESMTHVTGSPASNCCFAQAAVLILFRFQF